MKTATFTDPQGQHWTDAKLMIIDYSMNANSSLSRNHDISDLGNPQESIYSQHNVKFQVAYWPNQIAFDAGTAPYLLGNLDVSPASTWFELNGEGTILDLEAVETACENYLMVTILPPMQS